MKRFLIIIGLGCGIEVSPLLCGGLFSKGSAVGVVPAQAYVGHRRQGSFSSVDYEGGPRHSYCWDSGACESGYMDSPCSAHAQFIFKFYFHLELVLPRFEGRAESLACILSDLERYKKEAELPGVVASIIKMLEGYQVALVEGTLDRFLPQILEEVKEARNKGALFYSLRKSGSLVE